MKNAVQTFLAMAMIFASVPTMAKDVVQGVVISSLGTSLAFTSKSLLLERDGVRNEAPALQTESGAYYYFAPNVGVGAAVQRGVASGAGAGSSSMESSTLVSVSAKYNNNLSQNIVAQFDVGYLSGVHMSEQNGETKFTETVSGVTLGAGLALSLNQYASLDGFVNFVRSSSTKADSRDGFAIGLGLAIWLDARK